MVKPALQAAAFVERLPRRPYCTDDHDTGLKIRPLQTALGYRHIQHNPPPHVSSLVFDVDAADGYHVWRDRGLPAPHWISVNPSNGHAHLGYLLAVPVVRTSAAKLKPLRYLAAIEYVLARRLGADMGYTGLVTKNPTHADWWTVWHSIEPYTLDYLAEFCPDADLAAYSRRSRKEASGLGRNVTVFDNVREWAYGAVRAYWRPTGTRHGSKLCKQPVAAPMPLAWSRAARCRPTKPRPRARASPAGCGRGLAPQNSARSKLIEGPRVGRYRSGPQRAGRARQTYCRRCYGLRRWGTPTET